MAKKGKTGSPDFFLFFIILLLLSIGLIMVLSSSAYSADIRFQDPLHYLKRQFLWVLIGLVGMVVAMRINYSFWKRYANLFLVAVLGLLMLVLFSGITAKGATRSIGVGLLSFQPSELAKLALVIFLARYLGERTGNVKDLSRSLLPTLGMMLLVVGLVLLQPDLGTAVVIAGTTYLLLMAAGFSVSHLVALAALGVAGVAAAIVLAPYRMNRYLAFLDPWAYAGTGGWQTIQGLLALGSGGPLGLGLGQGRQKLLYVPERHTDFIFSIIGEELGLLGTTLVLTLFFLLVWRGYKIALEAPDTFGTLLAVGLTTAIGLQALINIGVVTGSLPVTGITLPLISYGGSSLVFTLFGLGILLGISRYSAAR